MSKKKETLNKDEVEISKNKPKNVLNLVIKSLLGLYVIGLIISLNGLILDFIGPFMMDFGETGIMTAELVPLADFIVSPVRELLWNLPRVIPSVVLSFTTLYLFNEVEFFTKKEFEVYRFVLIVVLAFVVL